MRLIFLVSVSVSLCLGLTDLEQKILDSLKEAQANVDRQNLNAKTIKEDGETTQTQKANADSQLEQVRGDLLMELTKVLVSKYGSDILPDLEEVDIDKLLASTGGRKKRYVSESTAGSNSSCVLDTNCQSKKNQNFRSITGVCNNPSNPTYGKAVTPLRRYLGRGSYADKIGSLRTKSVTGADLPSARLITNKIHTVDDQNPMLDPQLSHLYMQYGQFIAHDTIFMPSSTGITGETLDCSACNSSNVTENCAPIKVPADDTYFPKNGCIRLTRALNGQKGLGQRTPINQNTHLLDLSTVYGSDDCTAQSLRSKSSPSELKEFSANGNVLPPQDPQDKNCLSKSPFNCFLCGDFRNSLQPGLIPIHVLYIKMHNKYVRQIKSVRPDLSEEQIYQEARRVVIARYQNHVYNHYLPILLGPDYMKAYELSTADYESCVNPSLTVEFAAGAFRFGHSQARNDIPRATYDNKTYPAIDLGSNFFYADSLYDSSITGGTEALLNGMVYNSGRKVDRFASFPIRNQLFEKRGQKASGVDLIATNIQRGRDTGIFPYNDYRAKLGSRAKTWSDFEKNIPKTLVSDFLKQVYADVDDVDFYTAMLMENPVKGGIIGSTGAAIIAETFAALRQGDRFFYSHRNKENRRAFSQEEISAIEAGTMVTFICEFSPTIKTIRSRPFFAVDKQVNCSDFPQQYDMTYWAKKIPKLDL